MAVDKKISQLTSLAQVDVSASTDVLPIVDTSATETKKITVSALVGAGATAGISGAVLTNGTINSTTIGATTPSTGAFTTLSASGNFTLSGGTANGVLYLDGSKVATSGSSLSFNGTTLTAPQMTLTSANGITMNSGSGGLIDCSGNTLFIQFPSANSLIFRQSGSPFTEYMRLNSTGLGIGTTSPDAKLSVNGVASFGAGAAALPSVAGFGDLDTGMWFPAANTLAWSTGGSERMRIDSSGNVGIGGTADANAKVMITGTYPVSSNTGRAMRIAGTIPSGTTDNFIGVASIQSTQAASFTLSQLFHFYAIQSTIGAGSAITNQYGFFAQSSLTGATNNYGFYSDIASGSNRWNFYAAGTARNYFAGSVSVGTTTDPGEGSIIVPLAKAFYTYTTNYGIGTPNSSGLQVFTADGDFIAFQHKNGATVTERMRVSTTGEVLVGGNTDNGAYNLQCNGTGVWGAGAYVNGSDARLKDNIQSLDSGLDVVKAMRAVTFQYKPDYSKDQSVQPGFIAQELQTAMAGKPYLEGVVQEGPNHLNVAYQSIIPILVKAIQELEAKVAALEAK